MFAIKTIAIGRLIAPAAALFCLSPAFAALPIEHWTQPAGAQVYLVQSKAVPMVDVQIDFDAGARRDPAAQAGLAAVTASMGEKGVRAHGREPALDENAIDDAWADLGANFGAGATSDRMSFTLRSLTDAALLDRAARLAARQIGEPSFPDAIWQRERQRIAAALKEADTRPATQAGRAFQRAVYGGHPYGQRTTPQTLTAIGVADMRALQARALRSCGAKVSIVGALDRAQADRLATTLLGRLPTGPCATLPAVAEVQPLAAPQDIRIPFDSAQAHVYIGQPGFRRADPDYFALTVGNYILGGGGFVSRLTEQVREQRGLSYSVQSWFEPALHAGAFTINLQTRPDQAAQAVDVARAVLDRFVADGPTPQELQAAKDNLIGGFPLRIDSNAKLLSNVANIAWNGLPLDYLDTWTAEAQKVTADDIRAAFGRKLRPDRMVTVVVGGKP
ncbi:M16 family metallopeptidase [Xylophilus ampelinus]|uniref:Zinc protease n=1 Tax=Xylophilus ampelinus TaxID=54067 RepID=A0A318SRI9_9BURK|nr:pitrilysin family protein [Xylophilus ampelinus]MCS4511087.1 insulinase family protein [Xylophilus ampelinus]PYE75919.1 zinc protease [Xylophilus ampelinus]